MVDVCGWNPRDLWRAVNKLLQPPGQQATGELSADDLTQFTVADMRTSSQQSHSQLINQSSPTVRQSPPLSSFQRRDHQSAEQDVSKVMWIGSNPDFAFTCLSNVIASFICHNATFPCKLVYSQTNSIRLEFSRCLESKDESCDAISYRPISKFKIVINIQACWTYCYYTIHYPLIHIKSLAYTAICIPTFPLYRNSSPLGP